MLASCSKYLVVYINDYKIAFEWIEAVELKGDILCVNSRVKYAHFLYLTLTMKVGRWPSMDSK